jgi:hypothetical protein
MDRPLQLQQVRDGLATRRLGTNLHYFWKSIPPMPTPDSSLNREQARARSSLPTPKLAVAVVWVETGYLHLSLTCTFPLYSGRGWRQFTLHSSL